MKFCVHCLSWVQELKIKGYRPDDREQEKTLYTMKSLILAQDER